ncbi:MAG TPA: hypothetical protein VGD68_16550 [Streptosporangiaceae bacterium]
MTDQPVTARPATDSTARPATDSTARPTNDGAAPDSNAAGGAGTDGPGGAEIARSQQAWVRERDYLNQHRHELNRALDHLYPADWRLAGTRLMTRPEWRPAGPVPLAGVTLDWRPEERGAVVDPVRPAGSDEVRPLDRDGTRFGSYAAALAALQPPRLLENRICYRLLAADTTAAAPQLTFGINRYFDLVNVSEAVAHEAARRALERPGAPLNLEQLPLRAAIGDPLDLSRRSVTTGICTLILRRDRDAGSAQMFLHWRDPASVAVNGGLYQVAPAGMFQPSHEAGWNLVNDLGLWRGIIREVSEELLGTSEDYGSGKAPINYGRWPFYAALTAARRAGTLRGYWLGVGADPLTLDVDLLTVLVFDAPFFDAEFGGLVAVNNEGHLISGRDGRDGRDGHESRGGRGGHDGYDGHVGQGGPGVGLGFTAENVGRFTRTEAMQPAGAAVLALAWQHREVLLGS